VRDRAHRSSGLTLPPLELFEPGDFGATAVDQGTKPHDHLRRHAHRRPAELEAFEEFGRESGCVLRCERTFMWPVLEG
jgi:hypothetical protein